MFLHSSVTSYIFYIGANVTEGGKPHILSQMCYRTFLFIILIILFYYYFILLFNYFILLFINSCYLLLYYIN
jgi:hypothetical protein